MALELSCTFATSMDSYEHARIAEDPGFQRAWFYDSPALLSRHVGTAVSRRRAHASYWSWTWGAHSKLAASDATGR
jgi:hypothetical protein